MSVARIKFELSAVVPAWTWSSDLDTALTSVMTWLISGGGKVIGHAADDEPYCGVVRQIVVVGSRTISGQQ